MSSQANRPSLIEEFKAEFLRCWHLLPHKGMFFGLLAAWLLLFQFLGNGTFGYVDTSSLLQWMYASYNDKFGLTDDGIGNLVPFAVLALFWWKRKDLLAQKLEPWWPALIVLGVSLALHVVGYLVQQPRISIVALFTGIYGLIGLVWGSACMRRSFFPFFLFAFSVPLGSLAEPISFPLRIFVTKIVATISPLLGIDVIREGTQLYDGARTFQFEVAAACSGIQSLTSITAITTVVAFVSITGNFKRMIMIAAAFPLAIIGNVVRLMSVVLVADLFGQEWGNRVHDNAVLSILPYIPAVLGVYFLTRRLNKPETESALSLEAKPV